VPPGHVGLPVGRIGPETLKRSLKVGLQCLHAFLQNGGLFRPFLILFFQFPELLFQILIVVFCPVSILSDCWQGFQAGFADFRSGLSGLPIHAELAESTPGNGGLQERKRLSGPVEGISRVSPDPRNGHTGLPAELRR